MGLFTVYHIKNRLYNLFHAYTIRLFVGESEALLKVKLIYEAVKVAYGKRLSDSCTDPDERCLSLGVKRKRNI